MPTLQELLAAAADALAAVSPTPRLDAEVLLMYACGLTRAQLITAAQRLLTPEELQRAQTLVARRQQGEPVAYLTGEREFWSMSLEVTPAVLIPRPETEILVQRTLDRIPEDAEYVIADLGTGSGAIALALARARPRCRVLAIDISPEALQVAQRNARRYALDNIEFMTADWCASLSRSVCHIIVSNPPYVRVDDIHLQKGDVRYEPERALRGGGDGLEAIRRICADAPRHLRPPAWLLLEHGYDQQQTVAHILKASGYRNLEHYPDYAGQMRVVAATL